MVALLNQVYALTVIGLSLRLDEDGDGSGPDGVHVEVDVPDGPRLQKDLALDELGVPLDLQGIDRALTSGPSPRLRPGLREELRTALEPAPADQPVWLEFRRPFGHLPAFPWERLLQPHLDVPLLRLPFSAFATGPADEAPRVAVCAPWEGTTALRDFLQTVVPALPGAWFDVFTRERGVQALVPPGARLRVRVHEPSEADGIVPATPGLFSAGIDEHDVENPWLRWMARAVAPDSVDVLHVICPARVSRNFGMLDFGAGPTGVEHPTGLRLVSVGQLLSCLTRLGAASVTFTLPDLRSPRPGEAGLRIFAHRMTGLLSGPVVLQTGAAEHAGELATAYRFLYGTDGAPPPRAPTLMVACHPSLVGTAATRRASGGQLVTTLETDYLECTPDSELVRRAVHDPGQDTAWVASSQRLLERWTADVLGTESDPRTSREADRGVTDALSFISSVIEESVRSRDVQR